MTEQIFWYIFGGTLSFFLAFVLIFIIDWIKEKKKEKDLKKQFNSLYESFEKDDLIKIINLIISIGESEIEQKLNCRCSIYSDGDKIEIRTERWFVVLTSSKDECFIRDKKANIQYARPNSEVWKDFLHYLKEKTTYLIPLFFI